MRSSRFEKKSLFLIFCLTLGCFSTVFGFCQDLLGPRSAGSEQVERIRHLLYNKGFLSAEASEEISNLASQFSDVGRQQLYEQFRMRPGFLLSPPVSRFAFFPEFEGNTLKISMSVLGLAGTASWFYVAMVGSQYDSGPVTMSVGIGGLMASLVAAVYFIGLPAWEPKAYDVETVNRELSSVLNL